MTHPTKPIYKMLMSDYLKVSYVFSHNVGQTCNSQQEKLRNISVDKMLFDEADVEASMAKIESLDYHQQLEHEGIKFWCYNAGHVLGAAMFMVEIAGVKESD